MSNTSGPSVAYVDDDLKKLGLTKIPVTANTAGQQFATVVQSGLKDFYKAKATEDMANTNVLQSVAALPQSVVKGTSYDNQSEAKKSNVGGGTYTVNAGNQPYVQQLNSLYDQIMNRKPFQYDLNGDLLYRQMADQYTQLGQQAMRDTMGQAAALTGGYGNSYATQVGNQAYQQHLTALNEQVPSLYEQALNAYLAQGDQLLQQYELAAQHPGVVDAISPRTYTVAQTEEGTGTPINRAYMQALQSVLGGLQTAQSPVLYNYYDLQKYLNK